MTLRELYQDKKLLDELKEFFSQNLSEMGLKTMFAGKDTKGFAEANSLIEKVFDEMDFRFGSKPKKPKKVINNSR